MTALISAAVGRARAVLLLFAMLVLGGAVTYGALPREAMPEISIPRIDVSARLDGATPADAERLILEPLEAELSGIAGVRRMRSTAAEGSGAVSLEFLPGLDRDRAMADVRAAVARARADLPDGVTEPVMRAASGTGPFLWMMISGPAPERTRNRLAEDLRSRLEGLPGVEAASLGGVRKEVVEALITPQQVASYGITLDEVRRAIAGYNRVVTIGAIEGPEGGFVVRLRGLIDDLDEIEALPLRVSGNRVITAGDLALIRRGFEDPTFAARANGQPALILSVTKRSGANVLAVARSARAVVAEVTEDWPEQMQVEILSDDSGIVGDFVAGLQSNVMAAILLVLVVVVGALGLRAGGLVGIAIPASFLIGVLCLGFLDVTLNIFVLFSLILVVGMLVDGAIVVVDEADKAMAAGLPARAAYALAAERMAWPVIAGTATTLCVFLPLLFWDSAEGQIMRFIPLTVTATLLASLLVALILLPVLGGLVGRSRPRSAAEQRADWLAETGDPRCAPGLRGLYARALDWAILRPWTVVAMSAAALVASFLAYAQHNSGAVFFPGGEPTLVRVEALSPESFTFAERDALARQVEARLFGITGVSTVHTQVRGPGSDLVGEYRLWLSPWDTRPPARAIGEAVRARTADIAGLDIRVDVASGGPTGGAPVQIDVIGRDLAAVDGVVDAVRRQMDRLGGFADIDDSRSTSGIEWVLSVDRAEAARTGIDLQTIEQQLQLLTRGVEIGSFRPPDALEPIDVRVRMAPEERNFEHFRLTRVQTPQGLVPLAALATYAAEPRSGTITRVDQRRVVTVTADVDSDRQVSDQIARLRAALSEMAMPQGVAWTFRGEAEAQEDAISSLLMLFAIGLVAMFTVLVLQFDSFRQALIVMSAIVISVSGVLLAHLAAGSPFVIIMSGVGTIALAGIVVNNNIVLIDRFRELRDAGLGAREAALRTGAQRLRPVVLTAVTTALGLMPMMLALDVDVLGRQIVHGAPFTQLFVELSVAIVGGLVVATPLTLLVTPALLMLGATERARADLPP